MIKIDMELGAAKCDNFSELYFDLHKQLVLQGEEDNSRNGLTKEILGFKTLIKNPRKRCVGGNKRDINVFFLLAEALWIFAGKKDVAFLDVFNSKLKEYSDDGANYHAPYGWRLRNYNVPSISKFNYSKSGLDQIKLALKMLSSNPNDRRCVLSIWDPNLDLNCKSKDLPCNDLFLLKIRNNKLHTTIYNRSNDLNLGLTTNVFQFSIIGEFIANMLGVELGQQKHVSDSLHIYLENEVGAVTKKMINEENCLDFYSISKEFKIDFNFYETEDIDDKINYLDNILKSIILIIQKVSNKEETTDDLKYIETAVKDFSLWLYSVTKLLFIYIAYKHKTLTRFEAIIKIKSMQDNISITEPIDIFVLAANFFAIRIMKSKNEEEKLELENYKNGFFLNNWTNKIGLF